MSRKVILFVVFVAGVAAAVMGDARTAAAELRAVTVMGGNDSLGDQRDRWRTGNVQVSVLTTPSADSPLTLTYSINGDLATPDAKAVGADRPVSESFTFEILGRQQLNAEGLHGSLGASLRVSGPQTGIYELQQDLHNAIGLKEAYEMAPGTVRLPNELGLDLHAGMDWSHDMAGIGELRPFTEVGYGGDRFLRAGIDIVLGPHASNTVTMRDPISGFLMPVSAKTNGRPSLLAGYDMTAFAERRDLSEELDVTPESITHRARLGVLFDVASADVFFGQVWLSPEFEEQAEGQKAGFLGVTLNF